MVMKVANLRTVHHVASIAYSVRSTYEADKKITTFRWRVREVAYQFLNRTLFLLGGPGFFKEDFRGLGDRGGNRGGAVPCVYRWLWNGVHVARLIFAICFLYASGMYSGLL